MPSFNEKCVIEKNIQTRDTFGGIIQTSEKVGDFWCRLLKSDGFFKDIKGGKKRIQTIEIAIWMNKSVNYENIIVYNNIRYSVVNAIHNRLQGVTIIKAEFNN